MSETEGTRSRDQHGGPHTTGKLRDVGPGLVPDEQLGHASGAAILDIVEDLLPRVAGFAVRIQRSPATTQFIDLGFVRADGFDGQAVPQLLGELDALIGGKMTEVRES